MRPLLSRINLWKRSSFCLYAYKGTHTRASGSIYNKEKSSMRCDLRNNVFYLAHI
jgi:hypothetical protein